MKVLNPMLPCLPWLVGECLRVIWYYGKGPLASTHVSQLTLFSSCSPNSLSTCKGLLLGGAIIN